MAEMIIMNNILNILKSIKSFINTKWRVQMQKPLNAIWNFLL